VALFPLVQLFLAKRALDGGDVVEAREKLRQGKTVVYVVAVLGVVINLLYFVLALISPK